MAPAIRTSFNPATVSHLGVPGLIQSAYPLRSTLSQPPAKSEVTVTIPSFYLGEEGFSRSTANYPSDLSLDDIAASDLGRPRRIPAASTSGPIHRVFEVRRALEQTIPELPVTRLSCLPPIQATCRRSRRRSAPRADALRRSAMCNHMARSQPPHVLEWYKQVAKARRARLVPRIRPLPSPDDMALYDPVVVAKWMEEPQLFWSLRDVMPWQFRRAGQQTVDGSKKRSREDEVELPVKKQKTC